VGKTADAEKALTRPKKVKSASIKNSRSSHGEVFHGTQACLKALHFIWVWSRKTKRTRVLDAGDHQVPRGRAGPSQHGICGTNHHPQRDFDTGRVSRLCIVNQTTFRAGAHIVENGPPLLGTLGYSDNLLAQIIRCSVRSANGFKSAGRNQSHAGHGWLQ